MMNEPKDNIQQLIDIVSRTQEAQSKIYKTLEELSNRIDDVNDAFVEYKNAMSSKNPTEMFNKVAIAMNDIPLDMRFDMIKKVEDVREKQKNEKEND